MTSPNPPSPAQASLPAAPTRRRRPRWPLIVGAVLLAAVVVAGATYTAINLPHGCGIFAAAHHGVPCDVPLPTGATYERPFSTPGGSASTITEQGWVFSVAQTSGRALHDFYAEQLALNGWTCVKDSTADLPGGADNAISFTGPQDFTASKDTQALFVTYYGATSEVFILVDDLHAVVRPC